MGQPACRCVGEAGRWGACSAPPDHDAAAARSADGASCELVGEESLKAIEYFPMHTLPMRVFLDLEEMEPFESLSARCAVGPAALGSAIHFISHEWLGFRHPDPEGVQLHRMQQIFRDIGAGRGMDLFSPADWTVFSQRVGLGSASAYLLSERTSSKETDKKRARGADLTEVLFRGHALTGEVWLDFGSIPQEVTESDTHKLDAIRSIPAYLDRAEYFWVLAPPAKHADTGACRNFSTWRSRGWCRLEEWGNFLRKQPCPPLIVTHSPKLTTIGFVDFMMACQGKKYLAPCAGAFSCCRAGHEVSLRSGAKKTIRCDKLFVLPVLLALYSAKRRQLRESESGAFLHAGFTAKVEPMLFGGAPAPPLPAVKQEDETVDAFVNRLGFHSVDQEPIPGFSVWCFAAMLGHLPMLKRLRECPEAAVRLGVPVHDVNLMQSAAEQGHVKVMEYLLDEGAVKPETVTGKTVGLGICALDRAARGGYPEAVSFLLDRRANVNARRKDGATPLHGAAAFGHAACCQVLLRRRADVAALNIEGRSPVHLAANGVTLYGNADGKIQVIEVLLRHRADPLSKDGEGKTPISIAADSSFLAAEDMLTVAVCR